MKPIIQYDVTNTNYSGEFIKPNIIKVYIPHCNKTNRNIKNVIIHEYTHYIICNNKLLSCLFSKIDKYMIAKCRNNGITSANEVYKYLLEEKFCDFIANITSKRFCV